MFCVRFIWGTLALGLISASGQAPEFRGLWVDAFQDGFKNHDQVVQLVAAARAARFNAVLVEVRKRGDAYYQTTLEPRAEDIAPDYDPLADLLVQARTHGYPLEVHAWFVTYPVWSRRNHPPRAQEHLLNRHPEWLTRNFAGQTWSEDNYYLDPGHPLVQAHLFNVAIDLVSRYSLDGLHFDYIRYPGADWGYNPVAVQRFNAAHGRTGRPKPQDAAWLQFRRDQVTALLRRIYLSATTLQPSLKISAATITWTPSPDENIPWQACAAYSQVLQDWRAWMEEGILDLNIPMLYFRQHLNRVDWDRWSIFAKDHQYQRYSALGVGWYLNTWDSSLQQIFSARNPSPSGNTCKGLAIYSYSSLRGTNGTNMTLLNQTNGLQVPTFFAERVKMPVMPWKTNLASARLMGYASRHPKGNAIDHARIQVEGPASQVLTTDATGFYGLPQIPPGIYTVTVSAKGCQPGSDTITVLPGQTTVHSFELELLKKQ